MENEGKFKILVVDDEKSNLSVLEKILSVEYEVFTAITGEEMLDMVRDNPPDLILLDVLLPGIDGFEVLKQLKESPETRSIPVIIITGLDDEDDEEKGLLTGAVDYIIKPFKTAIVLARVKTHLQILNQMRTIERLGLIDPLTNIPNRRNFDDRLSIEWRRAIRTGSSISFLMIDVDKFKDYNDTWGHPQGDKLLRSLSQIFSSAARRSGDLAARIGGEEFGILLPGAAIEAASRAAEEIRLQVEQMRVPSADGKTDTQITISVGVASCKPDKDTLMSDFISAADKNLYKAKEKGRNCICY